MVTCGFMTIEKGFFWPIVLRRMSLLQGLSELRLTEAWINPSIYITAVVKYMEVLFFLL